MRPYLAVIRDSFHEALVSRVLWILLAMTTIFLLALLPLGFIEQAGSILRDEDVLNREALVDKIVEQGKSGEPSPGRRIWQRLDEPARRVISQAASDRMQNRLRFRGLMEALPKMIAERDFYRASDWHGVPLPAAAKALEAKGLENLPSDEVARFNRLALEAAYPNDIAPIPPKQIQVAYFTWELGLPLPVDPEQLFPAINQIVVVALSTLLGVAGVFVAVLVTASMIPQTFEAGSVDLLLSKPIDRAWLFLAKFVGGCAFIAINAAYFIGGLWLVLGLHFGLWNQRLLWAIPLYLFLFAIYYGVSSLAGIVWRNAIVSVVLAIVFWFVCWTLGTVTKAVETLSLNPRRLVTIVPAGDSLIGVNSQAEVFRWDTTTQDWQKIFIARRENQMPFMFAGRLAGPVYDAAGKRILAFATGMPNFSPLAAANKLLVGKEDDDWRRNEGVNLPDRAFALFLGPQGEILTASAQGIYRLEGDLEAKQQDINIFGIHIPLPERGGRFVSVGPKFQLRSQANAAIDRQTGAVALFDGRKLLLLVRDSSGKYSQAGEVTFNRRQQGAVAIGGGKVFLALADGEIRTYDFALKAQDPISSGVASAADAAVVSPDGRHLAVLYHNARLWLYDIGQSKSASLSISGQGEISAVAFDGATLLVADRLTRVTRYQLDDRHVESQVQGAMPLAEKIYRYALHPLYTVFPKPSELNDTVTYVLTAKDTPLGNINFGDQNQNNAPASLDVWGPVWSNLAFLIVVLAISCVYIYRRDF